MNLFIIVSREEQTSVKPLLLGDAQEPEGKAWGCGGQTHRTPFWHRRPLTQGGPGPASRGGLQASADSKAVTSLDASFMTIPFPSSLQHVAQPQGSGQSQAWFLIVPMLQD